MKIFDLIKVKDIEEFFGEAQVEEGKYTQLRLSVIKAEVTTSDEITREARVPSSVIKIVRPFEVKADETTTILLDFDAERSVVFTGPGNIQVKPVVKLSVNGGQQSGTPEENDDDEIVEEEVTVEITCEEFNAENHLTSDVIVPVNSQLVVSLCSNVSTGFAWSEAAEIGDTLILEQVQHEYIAPQPQNGEEPPPGTPGKEEWTFDTLSSGATSVSFEYSQPWEGGEKGVWSIEIMVTVE
jgi:predicted secreted protein